MKILPTSQRFGLAMLCLFVAAWQSTALGAGIIGIASMGASETQGTTFDGSWVPWLANDRGLNFGPGQSYNVAIGGSSSADLLAEGEHTQVAALVSAGKVNLSTLIVGGLDFPASASQILNGSFNPVTFTNTLVSNINTAVDTVVGAGPDSHMIVASVPDMTLTGGGQRVLTNPAAKQAVLSLVNQVNSALKPDILGRGQVYVDFAGMMRQWTLHPLVVGGVTIDTKNESASPDYLWLNDLHVAVIGNALEANMMLSAINKAYGLNYPLLSDQLILQRAGLSDRYTGETSNLAYQDFVYLPAAVPEPSTFVLGFAGVAILGLATLRKKFHRA